VIGPGKEAAFGHDFITVCTPWTSHPAWGVRTTS